MGSNFIVCLQAVLPMFILLAIGFGVRQTGIVTDDELTKMNKLNFKLLFPFLMFTNIYGSDIVETISPKLIAFTVAAVLIIYVLATLISWRLEASPATRGAMVHSMFRSNFVIIGLPLAINIYGHGNIGATAFMVAVIVPLYNVLAVGTLEYYRSGKVGLGTVAYKIATNPLIIGAAAGIIAALIGLKLPGIIETTVNDLAQVATPVALLILGASFKFTAVRSKLRNLTICVMARVIIIPGIVLSIAAALGIHGIYFITLVGIFAAPCAIGSYTMAREMDSDYEFTGNTVVFTSALACFTMFGWLLIFKSLGVF